MILHKIDGIKKNRIVTGIPIFMIFSGMMNMPKIFKSHDTAPTPAHTARHFAA